MHEGIHAAEADDALITGALDRAIEQIARNIPHFTHVCQNHSSIGNFYPACANDQWTTGFWPGQVWLAWEKTRDKDMLSCALTLVDSFLHRIERKIEVDHHDMGFLYSPSCVSAYLLTGSEKARKAALLAADQLLTRFHGKGGFLQAWGPMDKPESHRFIIDCLMNLPLLYWATKETGDERYRTVAEIHTATSLAWSIRPDGSTYHTFFMDSVTGLPLRGETCQGYKDDSIWARGQAWSIYGIALSYRYTGDSRCPALFRKVLDCFITHLPGDLVPYWDFTFTEGSGEPRDSSSSAIVACGLLEMSSLVDEKTGQEYTCLAKRLMRSLVEGYSVSDPRVSNGQLLHGTYSKKSPYNTCTEEGVDECVSWGDYFYVEALTRLSHLSRLSTAWQPYW
ncbi:glycoside hydrolase family 88 protein [Parasphaerochaeta coccoides]|uniref:Glycosyl hydrolase family 88 n=1 Tax=Parasphaerochaeta coccoides (strain ATCC BAA-1237 / DSM 17374 / SPN1) TaxID=760011 RepID=F4GLA1_PARC1|nr:glycoside hydrolase family 88 protein [Parasphaerochaeta coccoides]AEC02933.1 glycosyl hydrolase family 88 [Parasphaerochaeta coccoides DSM 17374]